MAAHTDQPDNGPLEKTGSWGDRVVTESVLGFDCEVFAVRPRHLLELLDMGRNFGEHPHLIQAERVLSFAQICEDAAFVANALQKAGVRAGDRVFLLGANSIEWVVAFWACVTSGFIAVPGNAWWSGEEVVHAVDTVTPHVAIVDSKCRERVPSYVPTLTFDQIRAGAGGEVVEPMVNHGHAGEDDPAVILFTSGTTGFPKGATLSHRSLIAGVHKIFAGSGRLPGTGSRRPGPRLLSVPLFHIGSIAQLLLTMITGGALVFLEGRFEAVKALQLIDKHGITSWAAVPTMVSRVVDELEMAGAGAYEISSLRSVAMGAAPIDESLRTRTKIVFPGLRGGIAVSYGLTEAGGSVSMAAGDAVLEHPGTVGKLLPTVDVRIDGENSNGPGEILVRSPGVMLGYWGTDSDDVLNEDRWLRTGDIGIVDAEGFLFLAGRLKDVIVRGGENIACARVEMRLLQHPAVAEAAVFGLPHPDLGEEVGAQIVVKPAFSVAEAELREFAAAALAHFEVPSQWSIGRAELPRTATGKIIRREIAQRWTARGGNAGPDPVDGLARKADQ
jgi:long-chain acyl-CoA synthetase